jgi:hypothetical protein
VSLQLAETLARWFVAVCMGFALHPTMYAATCWDRRMPDLNLTTLEHTHRLEQQLRHLEPVNPNLNLVAVWQLQHKQGQHVQHRKLKNSDLLPWLQDQPARSGLMINVLSAVLGQHVGALVLGGL